MKKVRGFTDFFAGQALSPDPHPSAAKDPRNVDRNGVHEIWDGTSTGWTLARNAHRTRVPASERLPLCRRGPHKLPQLNRPGHIAGATSLFADQGHGGHPPAVPSSHR